MGHKDFMQLALDEGKKGLGIVHPNPPVGCVIVDKNNNIIGRGAHLKYGEAHAEVNALNSVKDKKSLEGSSFYVTLEPCAHEAKTPSCAKTLASLPIAKVVYAVQDPNPEVSGQGAQILRNAGIQVEELESSILRDECVALAEIFHWNMKHNQAFVALKAATSMNGSLVPDTDSKWLTGDESRQHVHFLRSQYEAVLVGVDTFLEDNPKLNIRGLSHESIKSNYAIVLDPSGRGLERLTDSNILRSRNADHIIWVVGKAVTSEHPIKILNVAFSEGSLDLRDLVSQLWELKIKSIFIEGGAKTYGGFLNQNLVNRVYHYSSPDNVSEKNMLNWLSFANNDLSAQGPVHRLELGVDQFESFLVRT